MTEQQFEWWLSGLIDGEGCFSIQKNRGSGCHCSFGLKFRADDLKTLEMIVKRIKIGSLNYDRGKPPSKPAWKWRVNSQKDCLVLCNILARAPLQSKKLRDYKLWSQALRIWVNLPKYRGSRAGPPAIATDWSELIRLKDELHAIKKYNSMAVAVSEG